MQFELLHTAKLSFKHRGELAEIAFIRKAAILGFSVAKPWSESERYDIVLRAGKTFWRVQIKSVGAKYSHRSYYRVHTTNWLKRTYKKEEIDFLVAYIFPEDTWYIFPVAIVENRKALCLTPKSKRSLYEKYREAWKLLEPTCAEPAPVESLNRSDDVNAFST